jgi:hypothetical protein
LVLPTSLNPPTVLPDFQAIFIPEQKILSMSSSLKLENQQPEWMPPPFSLPHSVTGKMTLKVASIPVSSRRIQARSKDPVKVIVKFIRKGLHFQQTESELSRE